MEKADTPLQQVQANIAQACKLARRKIEEAVKKTGYIRNRAAQTIHGIRSGTIGVLIPTLDHAIFAEVVQALWRHKLNLRIRHTVSS